MMRSVIPRSSGSYRGALGIYSSLVSSVPGNGGVGVKEMPVIAAHRYAAGKVPTTFVVAKNMFSSESDTMSPARIKLQAIVEEYRLKK
eukprot:10504865-Ditylum_brightwellii.AAC.1